jgi:hypothetical protein
MTWVIGTSSMFGYGVVISDVQVRLQSGETRDMLLKAYPVANGIVGGFAGSVRIGFSLMENLREFLQIPEAFASSHAWDPIWVAKNWQKSAERVFQMHSPIEQTLGARVLLVGISPTEHRGNPAWRNVYMVRFASPEFKPGIMNRPFAACSIGSGAGVTEYKRALKQLTRMQSGFQKAEIGRDFGWADALCFQLSRVATDRPKEGVSRHFNVIAFRHGEMLRRNSDHLTHGPDGTEPIETVMPRLADSYAAFNEMVAAAGLDGAGAVC